MDLNTIEILGFSASIVVAISLSMSSIVKLRWFNMFGCALFAVYGFIIEAYPVAALNTYVTLANIYYLRKMYQTKSSFNMIKAESAKGYLEYFLDFHQTEVRHFFPEFDRNKDEDKREYYLLTEKTEVAGVLSGIPGEDGSFEIDLDFVIPAYRDCQLGQFMFGEEKAFLNTFGYSKITANAQSQEHQKYLAQIGFEAETNYLWRFKG